MGTCKWERVAVLATGPSLTVEDCEAVRDAGFVTIGVNSAWMMVPWIDVLYAGDNRYWKAHVKDIEAAGIKSKRLSRSSTAEKCAGAKYMKTRMKDDYNSGQLAIEVAIRRQADLVVLLGFDASVENGLHCHGPHKKTPNPNQDRCRRWHEQFARIPANYPQANIVNCSRETALTCFPRQSLEDVLASLPEPSLRGAREAQSILEGAAGL